MRPPCPRFYTKFSNIIIQLKTISMKENWGTRNFLNNVFLKLCSRLIFWLPELPHGWRWNVPEINFSHFDCHFHFFTLCFEKKERGKWGRRDEKETDKNQSKERVLKKSPPKTRGWGRGKASGWHQYASHARRWIHLNISSVIHRKLMKGPHIRLTDSQKNPRWTSSISLSYQEISEEKRRRNLNNIKTRDQSPT